MKKQKAALLFLLLFLLILPITLSLALNEVRTQSKAASEQVIRNKSGDQWADLVLGKIDFNQAGPLEVVPFKVNNPGGTIVDASVTPNRIYVYDGANSRILGYASIGKCEKNDAIACTVNADCKLVGGLCKGTVNKEADIVLGQPSGWGYSGCNNDANMVNYPKRSPAGANTLCSIPESQTSFLEGGSFASMDVDKEGNLYVPDFTNSRVLKFNKPFETDTVADEVWGQENFSGNLCNLTDDDLGLGPIPNPTNKSLCMGRNNSYQVSFTAGVDVDQQGNLWVADSSNHRVLRFPKIDGKISKTADLVLGQPDFTTREPTQLNQPAAVRVDANNQVYVSDYGHNRVVVYQPNVNALNDFTVFGSNFSYPTGIEFDPTGDGIWISDFGNNMLELWDYEGGTVKKVLFKDTYQPNGICGPVTPNVVCRNPQDDGTCNYNICGARGSIGLSQNGSKTGDTTVFINSSVSFMQDTWRFSGPIPTPETGLVYSADARLHYPPDGYNLLSSKGLFSPRSMEIAGDQFIVSDGYRVLFWNNYNDLTNGKAADGVVVTTSFSEKSSVPVQRISADKRGHLYVTRETAIDVYALPLKNGDQPLRPKIFSADKSIPVLGPQKSISWNDKQTIWDIAADPKGNYLWVAQYQQRNLRMHRVFRIKNPLSKTPVVDVILGHSSEQETNCNRYTGEDYDEAYSMAKPNTLCFPSAVTLDKSGNVWVSDSGLEFHGNNRLLKFDAKLFSDFKTSRNAIFGPNATFVSAAIPAWKPAFDSKNRMALGCNSIVDIKCRFPGLYVNYTEIEKMDQPSFRLKDYFSHGYASLFDENDNLYIADWNRGRILKYLQPFPSFVQVKDSRSR